LQLLYLLSAFSFVSVLLQLEPLL